MEGSVQKQLRESEEGGEGREKWRKKEKKGEEEKQGKMRGRKRKV